MKITSDSAIRIPLNDELGAAICGYFDDATILSLTIDQISVTDTGIKKLIVCGSLEMADMGDYDCKIDVVIAIPISGNSAISRSVSDEARAALKIQMDKMKLLITSLEEPLKDTLTKRAGT